MVSNNNRPPGHRLIAAAGDRQGDLGDGTERPYRVRSKLGTAGNIVYAVGQNLQLWICRQSLHGAELPEDNSARIHSDNGICTKETEMKTVPAIATPNIENSFALKSPSAVTIRCHFKREFHSESIATAPLHGPFRQGEIVAEYFLIHQVLDHYEEQ